MCVYIYIYTHAYPHTNTYMVFLAAHTHLPPDSASPCKHVHITSQRITHTQTNEQRQTDTQPGSWRHRLPALSPSGTAYAYITYKPTQNHSHNRAPAGNALLRSAPRAPRSKKCTTNSWKEINTRITTNDHIIQIKMVDLEETCDAQVHPSVKSTRPEIPTVVATRLEISRTIMGNTMQLGSLRYMVLALLIVTKTATVMIIATVTFMETPNCRQTCKTDQVRGNRAQEMAGQTSDQIQQCRAVLMHQSHLIAGT
jgi:hypothetical protein